MSYKKLTPAEAWEHVKALWPKATHIAKEGSSFGLRWSKALGESPEGLVSIDWPSGMDRYPPIEKPRRPARMPEDWNKPAWFRNRLSKTCREGLKLSGMRREGKVWIDSFGDEWDIAEVECDDPASTALTECAAERDGDCNHADCPQLANRQSHCPLDRDSPPAATEPEPEWITPTEEHIGQVVEVRDFEDDSWEVSGAPLKRIEIRAERPSFVTRLRWRFARIRNPKYKG